MFDEIDLAGLLEDRSPAPSGLDLEYDPAFTEMEQASQGKAEQQYGDTIIDAEPPEWAQLEEHSLEVLRQSHDMRASVHLASSALARYGLVAFSQTIALLRDYVVQRWDTIHPALDPEDDNDPTFRVNTLMSLCSMSSVLPLVNETPLVRVRAIGQFSLKDWKIAHNELPWPENSDHEKPEKSLILSAFQACEFEEIEQIKNACESLLADIQEIEDFVTEKVGSSQSCNFELLRKALQSASHLVNEQFVNRAPAEPEEPEITDDGGEESSSTDSEATGKPSNSFSVRDMKIKSRTEAIQALDKVCEYFEHYEPSSPLPLLLRRARRLSMKSFLEIIQDISPDGMHQVTSLGGLDNDAGIETGASNIKSPPPFDNSSDSDTY